MPTGEEPPPPPRPGSHCRMLPSGMLAQLSCSGRSRGHREAAGLLPTGCRAYKHRYDHCKYPQPHQRCGRQQKVPSPQPHRASAALTPADTEQTPNGRSYAAGGGRPAAPPRTFRPRSASPTPSSPHPAAPPSTHRPLRPRAFRCPPGGCAAPVDPTESPRRPEQPGPRCSTAVGHLPLSVGKEGGGAPAEPRCRGVLCSNPRFPRTRQRRRFSRGGPIVFPPPLPRGTAAPSRTHLPARASRSRTATAAPRSARSPSAAAAPRPRPGCRPWAALGGTPLLPAGDARGRAGRDNRSRPRSPSGRLRAPRLSRRRSAGSAQLTRSHQTAPAALQEKPSALPAPPPPRSLPFLRRRFLPRSAPARSGHRPAAEGVPGTGSTPPPPCLLPRGWAALAGAPRTLHQGSDPRH